MSSHLPLTRTLGVLYVVMGTILMLVTLGVLSLNWEVLGPFLVMGAGAAVLLGGAVRLARRTTTYGG
jgi:hypothetical protein